MNSLRQFFSVRTLAALRQNFTSNSGSVQVEPETHSPIFKRAEPSASFCSSLTQFLKLNDYYKPEFLGKSIDLKTGAAITIPVFHKLDDKKLKLVYSCNLCHTRNTKVVSKAAYSNGVVIVQCNGCSTNHLIIDNLGWFAKVKGKKNIDEVLAENADTVIKISINERGQLMSGEQSEQIQITKLI